MNGFFATLKERKLVQWSLAYIAAAFALIQILDIVAQHFGWPEAAMRFFILAAALGFFVTLVIAWYHGERGAQRVSGTELLILAVLLATGGAVAWHLGAASSQPAAASAGSPALPATIGISDKSIAVMPLVNMSGDASNEYFSDGVSEELINTLGKVRDLTVIGRNSSFQFKGKLDDTKAIAAKLGVAYLLEGSVRKASDRVRIAVNLVRASNSVDVWSESYDRELKDIFAVQSDIATSVAAKLQAVLGQSFVATGPLKPEAPPSGSVEAHNAYLLGRSYAEHGDEVNYRKAIEQYQMATRLDPDYAEAWARMAITATTLGANYNGHEEAATQYALSRQAIETALRLRSDLASAHIAKALLALSADFDFRGAEAEYRRATELDPQNGEAKVSLASMLTNLGQIRPAVDMLRDALVTDPVSARVRGILGRCLVLLAQYGEAEAELRQALELQPAAMNSRIQMVMLAILRNDPAAALERAQFASADTAWGRFMRAAALQIGTDKPAADAALQALIDHDAEAMSYQVAEVYAIRGDADKMFAALERAWKEHDPGLTFLLFDPLLLRFKDGPRYAALVKSVGLPVENLATTQVVAYRGH
jgi:serine/threonine-protein kinase